MPGCLRPLVLYLEVLLMIFLSRLESPTWKMPGCLKPLVLYLEVVLMILSTRLKSSSSIRKVAEATRHVPGDEADGLVDEAGVL